MKFCLNVGKYADEFGAIAYSWHGGSGHYANELEKGSTSFVTIVEVTITIIIGINIATRQVITKLTTFLFLVSVRKWNPTLIILYLRSGKVRIIVQNKSIY